MNSAGGSRPRDAQWQGNVWDESFRLNFTASRQLSEALVDGMIARNWGRVINISGAGVYRTVNAASPAKAALMSWSKSFAADVAQSGVTVNCIAPGRISTRQIITRLHTTPADREEFIRQNIPAGYFGDPEDLASAVVFLASERARYITGIVLPVDGDMHRLSL